MKCFVLTLLHPRAVVKHLLIEEFSLTDAEFLMAIERGMHPEESVSAFQIRNPQVWLPSADKMEAETSPVVQEEFKRNLTMQAARTTDEERIKSVLDYVQLA